MINLRNKQSLPAKKPSPLQAVILAAGESSRFWPLNQKHKSLIKILGKPFLCWLVKDLKEAGIDEIIIVQGPERGVEKELKECGSVEKIKYVIQPVPLGTGEAFLRAEKLIKGDWFFGFNADETEAKTYIKLILAGLRKRPVFTLLTSETKTPWLFGILKTKDSRVLEIVEKPKPKSEPSNLKNDNFFFFPREFFDYLKRVPVHPFSLINAINLYAKKNLVRPIKINKETLSLKFPWHLFPLLSLRMSLKDFKKTIAPSATIGRNVVIKGKVFIGKETNIGENTVIDGPCFIGDRCRLGPNNVLRGPVDLEEEVITGAFTEIKNCLIGKGAHLHSGYFGDSIIGENCRFGAGFVSANRRLDRKNIYSLVKREKVDTGSTYFGFACGSNTHFGINVSTMPGVFIGNNCIIGPNTMVQENLKDETTFYSVFKNIQQAGVKSE